MTEKPGNGDKQEEPQFSVKILSEKGQQGGSGLNLGPYMKSTNILIVVIIIAAVAIVAAILSRPATPAEPTNLVAEVATNTPVEVGTIQALETSQALLITPSLDPNVEALQTQNALLAQSLTDQAGTSQAVSNQPTQPPPAQPSPIIIVQPTQAPIVIIATTQPQATTQSGSAQVIPGASGSTVCPPATNDNYEQPSTVEVTGLAIVHPWWNNDRPSWKQELVRIQLAAGETITFIDMMGRVYTYQNTPACEANMPREFANGDTLRIVTVQELVSQGLASTENEGSTSCPTNPAQVAALIGGLARNWSVLPNSSNTGWKYGPGAPAIQMTAPSFGRIDYWNGQNGQLRDGQRASNITEASFWCGA